MSYSDIIFIGGDERMIYAAEKMSEKYNCLMYRTDNIGKTDVSYNISRFGIAVLPIVSGNAEISVLPLFLNKRSIVFAGKTGPELERMCSENDYLLYDYLSREEFAVMNAVLTAEGAVAIAIDKTKKSLYGADVLILGYGRIGKITARYFSSLGAKVSAAARKPCGIAWIKANGHMAVDMNCEDDLRAALSSADIIINTVPARILTGERADAVNSDTLLIELASVSCTDENAGFSIINAGGLPGKTAPITAGHIIADTIDNILTERSLKNGGA